MALAISGLFCTATTTLLWNWGIHHVPASRAGVFLNIEPALGSWLGVKLLGEHLGPHAWAGRRAHPGRGCRPHHPRPRAAARRNPGVVPVVPMVPLLLPALQHVSVIAYSGFADRLGSCLWRHAMALLTWSHACSVGVKAMDDQHGILMDTMNELRQDLMHGCSREQSGLSAGTAARVHNQHFASEEALMEHARISRPADHRAEHQRLLAGCARPSTTRNTARSWRFTLS